MADIQINATGGDVTEQTSIQIRRGSTATDSPPVEDGVEQFSAHEREELTETGVSREGRPIVPSSGYEDPLHYELYLVVFYSGPLIHTAIFGGCFALLRPDYWRPRTSI